MTDTEIDMEPSMQRGIQSGKRSSLFSDREFWSRFISIAIPVTLQNFLSSSLNLTDNIMVGQLGDASVAAVGLANQVYFILSIILFGIGGGTSIFISQFWGSRNFENIRKITVLGLLTSLAFSAAFFIPAFLAPGQVLSIFSSDAKVIELGGTYLKTVCPSFIIMAVSICFSSSLRSTGNVKLPLFANIVGIAVNTALNYIFIFGKLGFAPMGVAGSAKATLIARVLECAVFLFFIYARESIVAVRPKDLFHMPANLVRRFLGTSGAVITKDVVWAVGTALYMVMYAHINTEAVAAINIVGTIRQIAFVFFAGISNACLIMVGNKIGAGEEEDAYRYAGRFLRITLALGVAVGGLLIAARPLVLAPYNVSDLVKDNVTGILFVTGAMMAVSCFNSVMIVGAMRSGGDIKYSIVIDLIAVWVVGMLPALAGAYLFRLGVVGVYLLINLQEIYKFIFCVRRYFSKKWINNVVHGI
jgi:putative MATE family efflux protein